MEFGFSIYIYMCESSFLLSVPYFNVFLGFSESVVHNVSLNWNGTVL